MDAALEDAIRALLAERVEGASICPSEAARRVAREADFRPLMRAAQAAARRLVTRGEIEITQHGAAVDPATAKGPIRLRRIRRGA